MTDITGERKKVIELGFDLQGNRFLFFHQGSEKKKIVTLRTEKKSTVIYQHFHRKELGTNSIRGGFSHPGAKVLAFDVDEDQLKKTSINDIECVLAKYYLFPHFTEEKIDGIGYHAYLKFDHVIYDNHVKNFRRAMGRHKIKVDIRTTRVGLRFPFSYNYECTRDDLESAPNSIRNLYRFNDSLLTKEKIPLFITQQRTVSLNDDCEIVISRGNRVKPMLELGFHVMRHSGTFNDYVQEIKRKDRGSKDLGSWNQHEFDKETQRMWRWCEQKFDNNISYYSQSTKEPWLSNRDYLHEIEIKWARKIARRLADREFRKGKVRDRNRESLERLIIEYLGYERFRKENPHRTDASAPLSRKKRKDLETGTYLSLAMAELILHDRKVDVKRLHNLVTRILFDQFKHNNQGWSWGQYSFSRQYLNGCSNLYSIFSSLNGYRRRMKEKEKELSNSFSTYTYNTCSTDNTEEEEEENGHINYSTISRIQNQKKENNPFNTEVDSETGEEIIHPPPL